MMIFVLAGEEKTCPQAKRRTGMAAGLGYRAFSLRGDKLDGVAKMAYGRRALVSARNLTCAAAESIAAMGYKRIARLVHTCARRLPTAVPSAPTSHHSSRPGSRAIASRCRCWSIRPKKISDCVQVLPKAWAKTALLK